MRSGSAKLFSRNRLDILNWTMERNFQDTLKNRPDNSIGRMDGRIESHFQLISTDIKLDRNFLHAIIKIPSNDFNHIKFAVIIVFQKNNKHTISRCRYVPQCTNHRNGR